MLTGPGSAGFGLVNEYLAYLGDRNYSPKTVRACGFDLLAFPRWLASENLELAAVTTDVLLRFLSGCHRNTAETASCFWSSDSTAVSVTSHRFRDR